MLVSRSGLLGTNADPWRQGSISLYWGVAAVHRLTDRDTRRSSIVDYPERLLRGESGHSRTQCCRVARRLPLRQPRLTKAFGNPRKVWIALAHRFDREFRVQSARL